MEIGSLVTLSKRGETLRKNDGLVGGFGIIMEVMEVDFYFDVKVRWTCSSGDIRNKTIYLKRYEIKRLRLKE